MSVLIPSLLMLDMVDPHNITVAIPRGFLGRNVNTGSLEN